MKASWIALFAALSLLGAAQPVRPSIHIERTSFDLLDTIAIGVGVENSGKANATLRFPLPTEYQLEVLRGNDILWNSLGPAKLLGKAMPVHQRAMPPGITTLAVYEWNELTGDGSSLAAGEYTIRMRLLQSGAQPTTQVRVRFIAPTPIAAIDRLKIGDAITIAGRLDDTRQTLSDGTGSTKLPRRLIGAPLDAPVVVRGYITAALGGARYILVQRWAPLL